MDLRGKTILLCSVSFFGYEQAIVGRLEELGASVYFYDERPKNTTLTKGLIRLNKKLLGKKITNYFNGILEEIDEIRFDYVFVIKGEVVPTYFIEKVKSNNPSAKFILYLWDSIENTPNSKDLLIHMDRKLSFNPSDCDRYDLEFRPLFYLPEFHLAQNNDDQRSIDLLFICTAHTGRYFFGQTIGLQLKKAGFRYFPYYYLQSSIVYLYKFLFEPSFKGVKYRDLNFVSMSRAELVEYMEKSHCILDMQHFQQEGLTMRTIETIGAQRKLITTNAQIKNYDFYNEKNVMIVDRKRPDVDMEFFNSAYEPLSEPLMQYYSLDGWINTIFGTN